MFYIKTVLTAAVSFIAYLLGGWDEGIKYLLIAVCIDYFSGILAVLFEGGFKSIDWRTGVRGILKKLGLFVAIAVAVMVEGIIGKPESIHPVLAYGFAINEAFSVAKNLMKLGINMKQVTDVLSGLQGNKKDGGGEE